MSRAPHGQPINTRVEVELPSGEKVTGTVRMITPRGHRVELDDGRVRTVAWWRLVRLER